MDVAQVAEASGISAEELERLARIFASVPSQVAIPGGALAAQRNGAAALTAVQALNLILARTGQPGGVFPSAETAVEGFTPSPLSTFADVQALIERMAAGQVQLLFIHGANPLFELPAAVGFARALAQVPFVVSFSSIVDDTAVQADLILPDHTSLEGWGYHVPAIADRLVVSGQQPVMRPLYDTRTTVDVLLALAQQLGGSLSQALPWPNEVEFLKEMTEVWRDDGTSAEAFWSAWRRQGGWWPEEPAFGPTSRSPELVRAPLALAAPTFEGDPAEYPLHLHPYPSISLFDGRGANKSWLQEAPDPMTTVAWQTWIEINPHTAEGLGVKDNDVVRVISPAGEVEAIVYVYPGIQEGVVAMPVGQGHEHGGRFAKDQGSNPIRLLAPAVVGDTGSLAWAATRVRIVPTGRQHALARLESPEGVEYLRGGEH